MAKKRLQKKRAKPKTSIHSEPSISSANSALQNGIKSHNAGKYDAAIRYFRQTISSQPKNCIALCGIGHALREMGKHSDAIEYYNMAASAEPNHGDANAHYLLGNALYDHGQYNEAVECYGKAVKAEPKHAHALNNLGSTLRRLGRVTEAIMYLKHAIAIDDTYAQPYHNIGNALRDHGKIDEAITHYNHAILIDPNLVSAYSGILLAMQYLECNQETSYNNHVKMCSVYTDTISSNANKPRINCTQKKLLRIGFVSADFRKHSVSYFLKPFFEHYDKRKLLIYCYYNRSKEDTVTVSLQNNVDGWRDIVDKDDLQVAQIIQNDQIDILVDLSGHTDGNRLSLFARKPVAIQVTWLGYPDTTGLQAIDYRFTDHIADQPGQSDKHIAEQLIRLPDGFLCYQPPEDAPDIEPLNMEKSGYVTFVSFNNLAKVSQKTIKLWSNILHRTPNSRLLVKSSAFSCKVVRKQFSSLFEKESIDPTRIIMLRKTASLAIHLKKYGKADIGLDTYPYNGTTTTCEALWMGVPVVTLCGGRHVSRVGSSILTHVGLESLIADDAPSYIDKAVSLAQDLDYLKNLRSGMRNRMINSTLCNAKLFSHNMEEAFHNIWNTKSAADVCNN